MRLHVESAFDISHVLSSSSLATVAHGTKETRRILLAPYCTICGWPYSLVGWKAARVSAEGSTCHNPAMLLGQAGWMPFSNYVIQPNETGVTDAIVRSCIQHPDAPSSVVLHNCGISGLALRLNMAFGL